MADVRISRQQGQQSQRDAKRSSKRQLLRQCCTQASVRSSLQEWPGLILYFMVVIVDLYRNWAAWYMCFAGFLQILWSKIVMDLPPHTSNLPPPFEPTHLQSQILAASLVVRNLTSCRCLLPAASILGVLLFLSLSSTSAP